MVGCLTHFPKFTFIILVYVYSLLVVKVCVNHFRLASASADDTSRNQIEMDAATELRISAIKCASQNHNTGSELFI